MTDSIGPKMNCEVTIRSLGGGRFKVEGSWCDTPNKAMVEIEADPSRLPVSMLFEICEQARAAAEEKR